MLPHFLALLRHRWDVAFLMLVAVALAFGAIVGARFPDEQQAGRPRKGSSGCRLREYLQHEAEVPGCRPQLIPVRGCFGMCQTYEVPILLPPHKVSGHKMCSYMEVEWRTMELEDCDPGVNRTYVYHNAVRCRCRRCDPTDTYCGGI